MLKILSIILFFYNLLAIPFMPISYSLSRVDYYSNVNVKTGLCW